VVRGPKSPKQHGSRRAKQRRAPAGAPANACRSTAMTVTTGAKRVMDAEAGSEARSLIAAIGIDRYEHWQPLANAVFDARGATALFKQLGFEQVAGPLFDEHATATAIRSLVTDELKTLGPEDSLVLFYAGHGGAQEHRIGQRVVKTGYLIPVDAHDKVASWIDLESWLRAVSLLPAKHILVILDACHSGIALDPVIRWRDVVTGNDHSLATLRKYRSRRIITSARDDQIALDSGPVDGHSLFTGCLIDGLRNDLRRGGKLATTGSSLGLYLQERVSSYPDARQTPDFGAFSFDEGGQMIIPLVDLSSKAAKPSVDIHLAELRIRAGELITRQLQELRTKYVRDLYIPRDIDIVLARWVSDPSSPLLFVVDKAGSGKTNLVSQFCSDQPAGTFVLLLRAKFSRDLWADVVWMFKTVTELSLDDVLDNSTESGRSAFADLFRSCVIVVDGINEYAGTSTVPHVASLLARVLHRGVRVLITCRDLFWQSFDDDFRRKFEGYAYAHRLDQRMGLFSRQDVEKAVRTYFQHFNVRGTLSGVALEQCRFPLLLRFLCEAYSGQALGPQGHIRLKELFDRYVEQKAAAIASMSPGLGSKANLIAMLCDLASELYKRPGHQITFEELAQHHGLSRRLSEPPLFERVLDEDVIVQCEDSPAKGSVLSFVYDEFMDYLVARQLLSKSAFRADPAKFIEFLKNRLFSRSGDGGLLS
jgi:hypothetical protein